MHVDIIQITVRWCNDLLHCMYRIWYPNSNNKLQQETSQLMLNQACTHAHVTKIVFWHYILTKLTHSHQSEMILSQRRPPPCSNPLLRCIVTFSLIVIRWFIGIWGCVLQPLFVVVLFLVWEKVWIALVQLWLQRGDVVDARVNQFKLKWKRK